MASRLHIVLCLSLGLCCVRASLRAATPDTPADLKARVARLVEQLDLPDKQVSAQTELIKLGADILPLLPGDNAKLSTRQKERLKEIRATLTEAQVLRDLAPRLVTLQNKSIRLSEALDQIEKQTGEEVVDRREGADNPTLKLDLQKATFWQAVDTVAKEADLRVSLREEDGKVTLREGPFRALPTSYNGMFRITVLRLSTTRDLDRDVHECMVDMEIAWEPRFHPLFRQSQPENLVVQDDKGVALRSVVRDGSGGRLPIRNKLTADVQVLLEAPRRGVNHLGLLRGTVFIVGPSKMLTFTFDTLTRVDRSTPVDKVPSKTVDGVTARLRELTTENDLWTLGVLLEYPQNALEFESFESWLVHNEAFIENKPGKRYPPTGGYEIVEQEGNKAMINYRFVEEKGLVLGKPERWKLIYRTPGTISKVPIKFEFKDVPLP